MSDVVHELGTESGFDFAEVDPRVLKGFSGPVRVFQLLGRQGDVPTGESELHPAAAPAASGLVARPRKLLRRGSR